MSHLATWCRIRDDRAATLHNVTPLRRFLPLASHGARRPKSSVLRRLLPLAVLASLIYWVGVERRLSVRARMSVAVRLAPRALLPRAGSLLYRHLG